MIDKIFNEIMGELPEINENDSQEQVKIKIALIDYRADCYERARKIGVVSEAIPENYSDGTSEKESANG